MSTLSQLDEFGIVEGVTITALVDNVADMLLPDQPGVRRYRQEHGEPLLAEHGLAFLICITPQNLRILWDASITPTALLHNMHQLQIDASSIDMFALSHGHPDHYGGLLGVLLARDNHQVPNQPDKGLTSSARQPRLPIVMHPAALRERWKLFENGQRFGPMQAPHLDWNGAGGQFVFSSSPARLASGCWLSGEIPRKSFEHSGIPAFLHYHQEDQWKRDLLEDDQCLIINVRDKGLVIISGCAHSGIINSIRWAQELSGMERVHAILGGFHLAPYSPEQIGQTITEIKALQPACVAPSHCTGFFAQAEFARRMPEAFIQPVVGNQYIFGTVIST